MVRRHTFVMNSGDVFVFDPSSEAAIIHGVASVAGVANPYSNSNPDPCGKGSSVRELVDELGARFHVLRSGRFSVQCRVSFVE